MIYHVGISGGKDSGAALLFMVQESGIAREQIRATFCDTGNEAAETYDHVRMLADRVHPIEWIKPPLNFYELAKKKKRFPSVKSRFCTQELKLKPTKTFIDELLRAGETVIAVNGVRGEESEARAKLSEWGDPVESYFGIKEWRPLLRWKLNDVIAIHRRYGVPMNPLYSMGAQRVGCLPCIMSRKSEIRNLAKRWPERIDLLRRQEKSGERFHSFFGPDKVPEIHRRQEIVTAGGEKIMVASIDDVVAWSRTSDRLHNNSQYALFFEKDADAEVCPATMGACE
jgi:3'-phosphoadenosine 5'-phosphosulfate sulfotransferase (PAPS reductase)/FAD synthetase